MTDTHKLEDQTPENKSKVTGELTDSELNQVSGGDAAADAQKAADNKEQSSALNTFNQLINKL